MAANWQLPENYVREGLELARTAKFMGLSLESLTKEELLAVAAYGWKAYKDQLATNLDRATFLSDIGKNIYRERM